MSMYKVKYEDPKGVPCSIKIEAKTIMEAINKARKMRVGTNFRGTQLFSDEAYLTT